TLLLLSGALALTILKIQRLRTLLARALECRQAVEQPAIISVGGFALTLVTFQRRQLRGQGRQLAKINRRDPVPGQRLVERAFADILAADGRGQIHIRLDAMQLCALAGDAVELADRDRDLAVGGLA